MRATPTHLRPNKTCATLSVIAPAPASAALRPHCLAALPGAIGRLVLTALLLAGGAGSAPAQNIELPPGPGRALVYGRCRTCHDLQYVEESKGLDAVGWDGILDDMESYGVVLSPEERRKIVDYLATYMGDQPPPAPAAAASDQPADGAALYAGNCAGCHQENAEGVEETFPPLAGNDDLFLSKDFLARVILHGLSGPITVKGGQYDNEMPAFDHLSDAEIAALVAYLRSHFGNDAAAHPDLARLTAEDVAVLRAEEAGPEAVRALRDELVGKGR